MSKKGSLSFPLLNWVLEDIHFYIMKDPLTMLLVLHMIIKVRKNRRHTFSVTKKILTNISKNYSAMDESQSISIGETHLGF